MDISITKEQLAWAAGIFEGEGTGFRQHEDGAPAVKVGMTDEDVVRDFCSIVGIGDVKGPYDRGEHKPEWRWEAYSESAQEFVRLILPYMRRRRTAQLIPLLEWRRKRPAVAQCGTASGYNRHKRRGEPICDPCREAHNAASAISSKAWKSKTPRKTRS